MPPLNRLYEELKAEGLEVLLVNFRESADNVKKTAQERGYTAPVLLDASGDVTGRVYGVWGPPTAYLIDLGLFMRARKKYWLLCAEWSILSLSRSFPSSRSTRAIADPRWPGSRVHPGRDVLAW